MMRGCATGSACAAIDAAAIAIETRHEYLMSFQQVVVGCVPAVALTACHTSSPPLPNTVDWDVNTAWPRVHAKLGYFLLLAARGIRLAAFVSEAASQEAGRSRKRAK
jgi:hypothetical protein